MEMRKTIYTITMPTLAGIEDALCDNPNEQTAQALALLRKEIADIDREVGTEKETTKLVMTPEQALALCHNLEGDVISLRSKATHLAETVAKIRKESGL